MAQQSEKTKTILDVSRELGSYSPDAFTFLHESLDFTVQRTHGEAAPGANELLEWLLSQGCGPGDVEGLFAAGKLPDVLMTLIDGLGGVVEAARRLNRHVSGGDLCWGMRDLALRKWGSMASTVLHHWGIRSTRDIGRMVFALVDNGLLQKQPQDCIEDFDNVYDFAEAFDGSYKLNLSSRPPADEGTE
ncbi:MAG TPA: Minf_1886 family protein [Phycisphaerae bacterium]|nr:Minf_1886 family protein [Phycisphaerae bacterium]